MAAAVLAACGVPAVGCGGEEPDPRRTVREFVRATNERDADKLCGELVTQEFAEQTTGATGGKARDACKRQLRALQAAVVELEGFKRVEVDGDSARVTATLEAQRQRQDRVFRLRKEGGDWRVAGGSGR